MKRSTRFIFIVLLLALSACSSPASAVTQGVAPSSSPPGTVAYPYPVPIGEPSALPTDILMPSSQIPISVPYPAPEARLAFKLTQAAVEATTSPFPTAQPVVVQTGSPATARVQQDGVSLEIQLAKDTYMAGESGEARVTVHNEGRKALLIFLHYLVPGGITCGTRVDASSRVPQVRAGCRSHPPYSDWRAARPARIQHISRSPRWGKTPPLPSHSRSA